MVLSVASAKLDRDCCTSDPKWEERGFWTLIAQIPWNCGCLMLKTVKWIRKECKSQTRAILCVVRLLWKQNFQFLILREQQACFRGALQPVCTNSRSSDDYTINTLFSLPEAPQGPLISFWTHDDLTLRAHILSASLGAIEVSASPLPSPTSWKSCYRCSLC